MNRGRGGVGGLKVIQRALPAIQGFLIRFAVKVDGSGIGDGFGRVFVRAQVAQAFFQITRLPRGFRIAPQLRQRFNPGDGNLRGKKRVSGFIRPLHALRKALQRGFQLSLRPQRNAPRP